MNDLIKALEAASIDLGHLTEPPWCAYTHVVADVRNKVRAALPEFQSALARETKRAEDNGKLAHDLGIQNAALSRQLADAKLVADKLANALRDLGESDDSADWFTKDAEDALSAYQNFQWSENAHYQKAKQPTGPEGVGEV